MLNNVGLLLAVFCVFFCCIKYTFQFLSSSCNVSSDFFPGCLEVPGVQGGSIVHDPLPFLHHYDLGLLHSPRDAGNDSDTPVFP